MRIAIVLESKLKDGGAFQPELSIASLLNKHKQEGLWQFIFYTAEKENFAILKKQGIQPKYLNTRSISNKIYRYFFEVGIARRLLRSKVGGVAPFEKVFIRDRIDLVYFLAPSSLGLFLTKTNFMTTVMDLCHRDHPEFPEVNFGGIFESRERFFINVLPKAIAVVTNFESLKADIIRRYGCDAERVKVVKFLPSLGINQGSLTNLKEKYSLKERYIFYPAQFWAHKNHVYLLDGMKILRDKFGVKIDVVFSGSDKGNLQFVLNYAKKIGLENNLHYVGFVPDEEIACFYKQAIALVMPTYFGPTNIPPLEAFALGCPVCYPDLNGLRDQVQDAAFLLDLNDPQSLARHILTILNDPEAVGEKIKKGKQLLSGWTQDDCWGVFNKIFDAYARKMRCWKDN